MTFPLLLSIFKQTTSQNEHIELASLTSSAPHEDCLQQFRLLTFDNAHLVAAPWVQWYRGLKRQSSPCFSRKGGCGTTQAGTCPGEVRAVNVGCRWKRWLWICLELRIYHKLNIVLGRRRILQEQTQDEFKEINWDTTWSKLKCACEWQFQLLASLPKSWCELPIGW